MDQIAPFLGILLAIVFFLFLAFLVDTIQILRSPKCPECGAEMHLGTENHLICSQCDNVVHLGDDHA